MCVARYISPVTSAHVRTPSTYSDQSRGGKVERLVALARRSGHSLTSALKCVKCGLQVNVSHNCAYLEGILTLSCVGNLDDNIIKHPRSAHGEGLLMYHNIEAHASHTMATSSALRIHFCVSCGAYGASRSKHLKAPCPHKAFQSGPTSDSGHSQGG